MEGELKRIQADIEQVKRSHKSELDKTNSEMGEVIQRLGKREEVISKLEKDKREVALARDKALKQIEDIDKVRLPYMSSQIWLKQLFTTCLNQPEMR